MEKVCVSTASDSERMQARLYHKWFVVDRNRVLDPVATAAGSDTGLDYINSRR